MNKEIKEFFLKNFYEDGKNLCWNWREDCGEFPMNKKLKAKIIKLLLEEKIKVREDKKMTEFNLSEKIRDWLDYKEKMIDVEDVKEFIRQEMFLLEMYWKKEITFHELIIRRNKLAGDDLTKLKGGEQANE